MNMLILGGESQRHQVWVRELASALEPNADDLRILDYRHWQTNSPTIDVEYEIEQAARNAPDEPYVVVAKSMGSVVTTLAVSRGLLKPDRCIFMGFPLAVVMANLPEVAAALPKLPPTDFLHNTADPLGSFQAVQAYITAHSPAHFTCCELPGDTHDYSDFNRIKQLLDSPRS
ncbi:MAG TPA: hypothetical protein VG992_01505 [Candidatus Saccharimonadales bacterium]|nr:hypothetical protein [Candidatus Saccharimonadales bacterium]